MLAELDDGKHDIVARPFSLSLADESLRKAFFLLA